MLDNLKQQNRLSVTEERKIENKIRIILLIAAAIVIAFVIWTVMQKKPAGPLYYVIMIGLLVFVWVMQDVVGTVWKHALAQRSDEQVSAYLKAAAMDFVAYAGLTFFLVSLNSNAIIGAAIYVFGVTGARKQRDIYYTEPGEDDGENSTGSSDISDTGFSESNALPADSGSSGDGGSSAMDSLPSAADRELREQETAKEEESV